MRFDVRITTGGSIAFTVPSSGIVTWNSAHVIEACVASVRAQTYRPLTLRILDNASADDTRERLKGITAPVDEAQALTRDLAKALASLAPQAAAQGGESGRLRVPAGRAGDKPPQDNRSFIRSRIKEKGLSLWKEERA